VWGLVAPGEFVNVPVRSGADCKLKSAVVQLSTQVIVRSFENQVELSSSSLATPDAPTYSPPMIAAAQIEQMTLAERMEAMELLWRSISSEPASVVSPAWHGEVLQKRLARIKAGKAKFLTVAQLKKRLGKRRG